MDALGIKTSALSVGDGPPLEIRVQADLVPTFTLIGKRLRFAIAANKSQKMAERVCII